MKLLGLVATGLLLVAGAVAWFGTRDVWHAVDPEY